MLKFAVCWLTYFTFGRKCCIFVFVFQQMLKNGSFFGSNVVCFCESKLLPHSAVLARYMLLPCLFVRPSHIVSVLSKMAKRHHAKNAIAQPTDSIFLAPKILAKFQWVTANGGIIYRRDRLKLEIFDQCLPILETVQDRDTATMDGQ